MKRVLAATATAKTLLIAAKRPGPTSPLAGRGLAAVHKAGDDGL